MRKIRVGFIISTLNRAGAEGKLVAVANGLNSDKFNVHVFVLKSGPLTESLNVPFVENVIPTKYSFSGFFRFIKLIRKAKLDIIWIVGTGDAGFFGRLAAKLAGVQSVILSFHATTRPSGKPTIDFANRILNKVKPFTDRFVAVAKNHMQHLINNEGVDPARILFIHNGVDIERFQKDDATSIVNELSAIPEGSPVLGIIARFKPEKRHDIFLEAGKVLLETHPDLCLLLIGDGPLMNETRERAVKLGILDRVVFTGGLDDVTPALHRMTVSVLCSDMEAFPNAVLESMAAGVPVVSTDVGSVSEAVTDGVNGILIPKDDPDRLAEAVHSLLSNGDLRKSISREGLKTVKDKFSLHQMITKREDLFEDMFRDENYE